MPISWNEIRDRATRFARDWSDASYERGQAQSFWNEFFGVFGMHRSRVYSFEKRVEKLGGASGYIDCFWPGVMIAEHKSRGKPLGKAHLQALEYLDGLKDRELPRYIVVSDFERIRLYDLESDNETEILTAELPTHIRLFGFIAGYSTQEIRPENPVNVRAAERMGKLHDRLRDFGYEGHDLEVLLVRLESDSGALWFTGLGIAPGKTWRELRGDGWLWRDGNPTWQPVPPVPAFDGLVGRLGSHAVAVAGAIHVIGGYTVAEDHSERSTPGIWRLEIAPEPRWVRAGTMPVPVDDAVAVVWRERTLLLVSGWSDTGNVNLVQLWTPSESAWSQAEPWPGAPVFGHAGGLIGDVLVVCGGARVHYPATGPRQFLASDECWQGRLRGDDSRRLDWRPLPPMPGGPRYRAAALGLHIHDADRVIFAGGADRPYNYDGEGYDGTPALAIDTVVSFNIDLGHWECHGRMPEARMDHRGLLFDGHRLVLPGGMDGARRVRAEVLAWPLAGPAPCEGDGEPDATGNEAAL